MQVDKFMSISGYKRRQRSFSIRSRSPRGTSPPSPPPPPPPTPPPGIQRPPPPPSVPNYPPPKLSNVGGHLQGQPQHSHASRFNQQEQYYDSQKRLEYSRSVDWGHRDYGRARPYISPSDDPLAAFQVLTNNDLRLVILIVHK